MDVRLEKARTIAKTVKVRQRGGSWLVPSQSGRGGYVVAHTDAGYTCTCPDFEYRRKDCKHILAVCIVITQEATTTTTTTAADGSQTTTTTTQRTTITVQRPTYKQNWPKYNAAQTEEKATFQRLLHDLCAGIAQPAHERGRRPVPLSDMVFAGAFKVYSTFSGRRFMTDLEAAHAAGYLTRTPHYNTIFKYLEMPELTPLLQQLVTVSSLPLKAVEANFAVDSSGFSTHKFTRWFDAKYGDAMQEHDWMKVHLICGVKTNVVTSVEVTDKYGADSPQFGLLVANTARFFTLGEVSADKAYSSRPNLAHVANRGATPYIPFRSNATGGLGPMTLWKRLFHYYSYEREAFLARYHQRSNVESTFSMLKRKFGDALRSKTQTAQFNEALLKVLCHNICCVISSMHELGVSPAFWQGQVA